MKFRTAALATAFAASLGMGGAMAQTQPQPRPETPQATPSPAPAPGAPTTTAPADNRSGATAPGRGTTGGGMDAAPPAASTDRSAPRTAAAPVAGANSFTEGQARSRITDAGFADVQGLRLDEQGIWRGRAMRNGQQTGVALDYQGNVVATQ